MEIDKQIKGVSVIVRAENEYNKIVEFLTSEAAYLKWNNQMETNETAVIIWSENDNFSVGAIGSAEYQRKNGIRTVEFSNYFKP